MRALYIALLLAVAAATGCERESPDRGSRPVRPGHRAPRPGIVARVGSRSISAAEVADRARAQAIDGLDAPGALDAIIREEVLLVEARRRGIGRAPAIRADLTRALVQRFFIREVEEKIHADTIPESVLRESYELNRPTFEQPERRSGFAVTVRPGPNPSSAQTAQAHALAAEVGHIGPSAARDLLVERDSPSRSGSSGSSIDEATLNALTKARFFLKIRTSQNCANDSLSK